MPTSSSVANPPHLLLRRSVNELLRTVLAFCDVRFGIVRLKDEAPIVSEPGISLDAEASLAFLAGARDDELVIFDEEALRNGSPEIRFYASVRLADSSGAPRGTLALVDDRTRSLTDLQKELLIRIAGQLGRDVEMAEALRTSREEHDRPRPLIDVTDQVAASRQLREREEYFRALADHFTDVVAILTREHVLTYISPSIGRVLGHEPDELLGKVSWAEVHSDDRERFSAALTSLAGGHELKPAEFRFQHKGGRWRTLEVVASNLLDHPHIRGLVLNLRDVTDRKRMTRELEQLHRLTSVGRLAAQMAHEFNNVLMGIQPMIEAIRRRANDDATLLRFTDIIRGSIQRGKQLTTDILRFGRPAEPALRTVDVQELLERTADEIRPMLGDHITVELIPPATPMHVRADPAQLAQVFVNRVTPWRRRKAPSGSRRAVASRGNSLTPVPSSTSASPTPVPASPTRICRTSSSRSSPPNDAARGSVCRWCSRSSPLMAGTFAPPVRWERAPRSTSSFLRCR
jgi:PAS domain S-box-containing protein